MKKSYRISGLVNFRDFNIHMVNTFLPFANFKKCAKVLDNKRLGKQRVEAKQIISILTDATKTKGWRSHPAVLMWKGHAKALM